MFSRVSTATRCARGQHAVAAAVMRSNNATSKTQQQKIILVTLISRRIQSASSAAALLQDSGVTLSKTDMVTRSKKLHDRTEKLQDDVTKMNGDTQKLLVDGKALLGNVTGVLGNVTEISGNVTETSNLVTKHMREQNTRSLFMFTAVVFMTVLFYFQQWHLIQQISQLKAEVDRLKQNDRMPALFWRMMRGSCM